MADHDHTINTEEWSAAGFLIIGFFSDRFQRRATQKGPKPNEPILSKFPGDTEYTSINLAQGSCYKTGLRYQDQ